MKENKGFMATDLGRIAAEDRERQQRREFGKTMAQRRRGNKGSRTWGYRTPGTSR